MKKSFYFLIFLVGLVLLSFLILNYLHTKRIKITINEIRSTLADLNITMEFDEQTFDSYSFMNKHSKLKDVEIYTKLGDSVLYFKIPTILINSSFKLPNSLEATITLPKQLDGYVDLDSSITKEFNTEQKYEVFIENSEDFKIESKINKVFSKESSTNVEFVSKDFIFRIKPTTSDNTKEVFNIKSISVSSYLPKIEDLQWKHVINLDDLSILLYPKKVIDYLPQNISIDDASKNIFSKINVSKLFLKDDELKTYKYDFDVGLLNKAFEGTFNGYNLNQKNKNGKSINKSDIDCKIKHFLTLLDYVKSIILVIKENDNNSFDKNKLDKQISLFKSAIMQNAEHGEDDTIFFKIKDIEKQTFFQNKLIEEVFADFIETIKEN